VTPVFTGKLDIKLNKGFLKAQAKFNGHQASRNKAKIISNIKNKICYTCRQKGHLGKDCPKGENPKPKLVHSNVVKYSWNSNDSCAATVVVSPRTGTKAIWVPKSLFSNIVGPNTC